MRYLVDSPSKNPKSQLYKLHCAKCLYNGRLKRIAVAICITQLTCHIICYSSIYYMLFSDVSLEEISYGMINSSIEITRNYLNKLPKLFSDVFISRFADEWEILN